MTQSQTPTPSAVSDEAQTADTSLEQGAAQPYDTISDGMISADIWKEVDESSGQVSYEVSFHKHVLNMETGALDKTTRYDQDDMAGISRLSDIAQNEILEHQLRDGGVQRDQAEQAEESHDQMGWDKFQKKRGFETRAGQRVSHIDRNK